MVEEAGLVVHLHVVEAPADADVGASPGQDAQVQAVPVPRELAEIEEVLTAAIDFRGLQQTLGEVLGARDLADAQWEGEGKVGDMRDRGFDLIVGGPSSEAGLIGAEEDAGAERHLRPDLGTQFEVAVLHRLGGVQEGALATHVHGVELGGELHSAEPQAGARPVVARAGASAFPPLPAASGSVAASESAELGRMLW